MAQINPALPADGDEAIAESVNEAFLAIIALINGNIDSDNLLNGSVTSDKIASGAITSAKLASSLSSLLPRVGSYRLEADNSALPGFLLCDGSDVSRSTYSDLFAKIGTGFGDGDGSTTFTLPNFQGVWPVMADSGQSEFDALGKTGGEKTHTLTVGEMPSHSHSVTDPGHTHALSSTIGVRSNVNFTGTGLNPITDDDSGIFATSSTTGISIQNNGSSQAHNNLPPYQVAGYWFIKF